ncbi:copper resistance protein CopC [Neobacillus niacini]|uniref:copper resistance CopC family protein n=1 Tax=Neobacillus niacini TaxID=86668 RepID=UPI0021CB23D5|nr:copper resistance protein CopC [Neobacillus niacini]MCM3765025.1 copper resistance protein CopC [Neobacillus niacini]
MLKKISFIISTLFFLLGTNVFAHSHFKDSNPKSGEVVTDALENITLSYETKVESTSTFSLTDQNGTNIPLSQVSVNNNQLVGTLKDELADGGYTIHWKIIGADGHPLEGEVPFSVQLPENQTADGTVTVAANNTSTSEGTTAETENVKAADTSQAQTAAVLTQKAEPEEATFKDYMIPVAVGLLIVFGAGSYWLFYRRKHV